MVRNKKTKKKFKVEHAFYKGKESSLWQNIYEKPSEPTLVAMNGVLINRDYEIMIKGKWLSRK